jgi:lysozyme family protein
MAKRKTIGKKLSSAEYVKLYSTMHIDAKKNTEIDSLINRHILPNKSRYVNIRNQVVGSSNATASRNLICFANPADTVSIARVLKSQGLTSNTFTIPSSVPETKGIPWFVIALIHYIECGFSFSRHLFNGDLLSDYTHKYPPGYPHVNHKPPFTFDESAVNALKYEGFDKIDHWNVAAILQNLEKYNGFGYEMYQNMNSPYLWSGSDIYKKGKYVEVKQANGKWKTQFNANDVSTQLGTAVILKRMELRALINIVYN